MKILMGSKDGGPESTVRMWGLESKRFGSILVLCFAEGSREAFHSHAFKSISWLLSGCLVEETIKRVSSAGRVHRAYEDTVYVPSVSPIRTPRERMHKVSGFATSSWVVTFRGPWEPTWLDWSDYESKPRRLSWGRKEAV